MMTELFTYFTSNYFPFKDAVRHDVDVGRDQFHCQCHLDSRRPNLHRRANDANANVCTKRGPVAWPDNASDADQALHAASKGRHALHHRLLRFDWGR